MVRFIYSRHPMDHVGFGDLKLLSWLSIPDRVRYFKMVHVFRIRAGLAPHYLSEHFTPVSAVHTYKTRGHSFDFHVSKEISKAQTSFAYSAILNWNALPESIKGIQSLSLFKSRLKSHLLSNYWYLFMTDFILLIWHCKLSFFVLLYLFLRDPDGNKSKDFSGYPWLY